MRIEYEDQEILVIYKEAGLPVQSGRTSRKDVVSLLKNHLAQALEDSARTSDERKAAGREQEPYLGIIHRLDQPVEGLLVFAKTQKSAAALSAQAAAKDKMEKAYQAVVCLNSSSYPLAIEGMKRNVTLVDWLGRDTSSNTAYIAKEDEEGAKRAELVFRTLWIRDGRALLEIRLHTGRHHQIRVQMANAGMPLLGDRKYGIGYGLPAATVPAAAMPEKKSPAGKAASGLEMAKGRPEDTDDTEETKEENSSRKKADPLCLCAWRLTFRHPVTGKKMQFCVEPSFASSFLL